MDWFLWIQSQYSNLRGYLPVWCNQDVALKSFNSFVNLCMSSRPFVPLYNLTCDSQLVCSSYNPSIFSHISPSFSNVWSLSSHSFTSISFIANLEWTFANILTRYLCSVDLPVPWRHNLKIFIMLESVISSLHVGWYKMVSDAHVCEVRIIWPISNPVLRSGQWQN